MEKKIRSWDVFDTLIARRFINNDFVLRAIENNTKLKGFVSARKSADNGTKSLLEIYETLATSGVIPKDQIHSLYRMEIDLEKEHTFALPANMNRVSNGDLLISDMYLSGADILELVRNAGLKTQVTIYQSNRDKSIGTIWQRVKDLGISVHCGDNERSDIANAKEQNIETELYKDSVSSTKIENLFFKAGLGYLGCLLREVRLSMNDIPKDKIEYVDVSNQVNLPWLLTVCEMLHRKHGDKNLVFLGRDCQLLYKLYNAVYTNAYYIPFSRKVAYAQPTESINYLKSHMPPNSILVDISSTGATWEKICALYPFPIEIVIYADVTHYSQTKPIIPNTFTYLTQKSVIGKSNEMVEVFNCADHGVLSSLRDHNGVICAEYGVNEIDESLLHYIHLPIETAIKTIENYKPFLREEMGKLTQNNLIDLFSELLGAMCARTYLLEIMPDYIIKQKEYTDQVAYAKNS